MAKTLADMNNETRTREWSGYTLRAEYAVIGWQKTHIGRVEYVVSVPDNQKPGRVKVGQVFSAAPFCNGNGQRVGNGVRSGLDTKDVTCLKCRKALGF